MNIFVAYGQDPVCLYVAADFSRRSFEDKLREVTGQDAEEFTIVEEPLSALSRASEISDRLGLNPI